MTESDKQNLGDLLSSRRRERGFSIEEAAKETKIKPEFLRALEENHFERIPGETYLVGFLRTYGRFLGFNADELMLLYRRQTTPRPVAPPPPPRFSPTSRNLLLILAAVLIVGIILYFLMWYGRSEVVTPYLPSQTSPVEPETPRPPPDVTPGREDPRQEGLTPSPLPAPAPAAPGTSSTISERSERLTLAVIPAQGGILRLQALGPGSLEIWLDSRLAQHYALQAGTLLNWRVTRSARLLLGDPASVKLWLDERPLDNLAAVELQLVSLSAANSSH